MNPTTTYTIDGPTSGRAEFSDGRILTYRILIEPFTDQLRKHTQEFVLQISPDSIEALVQVNNIDQNNRRVGKQKSEWYVNGELTNTVPDSLLEMLMAPAARLMRRVLEHNPQQPTQQYVSR